MVEVIVRASADEVLDAFGIDIPDYDVVVEVTDDEDPEEFDE